MHQKAAMASIHNLPTEILGEMFLRCLPESPRDESQPNTKIAPILLCHVCSVWRTTALRLPKLWARLCMRSTFKVFYPVYTHWKGGGYSHLKYPIYEELPMHPCTLEFLTWWKDNARSVPIDLYLDKIKEEHLEYDVEEDGTILDGTPPGPEAMNALEFALAGLPSVRHFEMAINRHAMEVLCKAATPTTFGRLESLTVNQYFHIGIRSRTKFVFAFPPAPRLRRLALTSYVNTISFCWTQLTHLCVSCAIKQDDWFEVLTNCKNLLSGVFNLSEDESEESNLPPIVHPNLRQLFVIGATFRSVSFPGLKALRILPNRTIDTLEKLAEILRKTPALTELHFDSRGFSFYQFFSGATPEESCWLRNVLPDLNLLSFEFTHCSANSNGRVIAEVLKSEWVKILPRNGQPSLLRISFESNNMKGYLEGLRVVITTEELDSMKRSDIVRAIEEFHSTSDGTTNIELRFPAVGDEKRSFYSYLYDAEDLPRWDEVMGFREL
ncbi:unnamed protein product [Cyclocybe aegerita]|uniref:F-box domain-containing protein n=1 Tax=Cyclocybe aegerita TaxID=1973307 RepID=A0A8S0XTM7_CYCAE|nr:unnamed protein product [Cyclocybe aegerita]